MVVCSIIQTYNIRHATYCTVQHQLLFTTLVASWDSKVSTGCTLQSLAEVVGHPGYFSPSV